MDSIDALDMLADSPDDLDMCSRGDLCKAENRHIAGDPHALPRAVIYCLEQGIPVPAWAAPGAVKIMQKSLKTSRKNTKIHTAQTARAAALHAAEDHLGFGYGYDTKEGEVCRLAEKVLVDNFEALRERGIVVTDTQSDWTALKDWWYKNHGKNRHKFGEPDYDLYGLFLQYLQHATL